MKENCVNKKLRQKQKNEEEQHEQHNQEQVKFHSNGDRDIEREESFSPLKKLFYFPSSSPRKKRNQNSKEIRTELRDLCLKIDKKINLRYVIIDIMVWMR